MVVSSKIKIMDWFVLLFFALTYFVSNSAENAQLYSITRIFGIAIFGINIFLNKRINLTLEGMWRIVFILYAASSLMWSRYPRGDCLQNMLIDGLICIMLGSYFDEEKKINRVIFLLGICGVISSIQLLASFNIFALTSRMELAGENINTIGLKLIVSSASFLYLSLKKGNLYLIGFLLCTCIAFFSGSKKVILSIVVLLFCYYFMRTNNILGKIKYIILALICIGIIWKMIMEIPLLYEIVGERVDQLIDGLFYGDYNASDQIRSNLIIQGLELFRQAPLKGIGLLNFEKVNSYGLYAHNNYVEILCDLGILGVIIYYSIFVIIFVKSINAKKESDLKKYALLMMFMILANDIALVSFYTLFWQLMISLSYISASNNVRKERK